MRISFAFLLSIILLHSTIVNGQEDNRVGYAYDKNTNELIYTETHNEVYEGNSLIRDNVVYRDEDGVIFAEKDVNYIDNSFAPDFLLNNKKTGHKEGGQSLQGRYEVKFSKSAEDVLETKNLELPESAVVDAGFDQFIEANWEKLIAGENMNRKFLVPSFFKFYNFRIYQAEEIEKQGRKFRVIHVEPDNFLYRFFGGTTRLEYDFDAPLLRKFSGVSNMRDANGNNYEVNILFPTENERIVKSD